MQELDSATQSDSLNVNVNGVEGSVVVVDATGQELPLHAGDQIPANATLLLANGATIQLSSPALGMQHLAGPLFIDVSQLMPQQAAGQDSAENLLQDLLSYQGD